VARQDLRSRALFRPGTDQFDRRDEAVAMLGYRFDEARAGGVVSQLPAQRLDALGQRLVGDGHAVPDLVVKPRLGDELSLLAHQQREGVEIAGIQLHRRVVAAEPAVARIEKEALEAKAAGTHVSAVPQPLLLPLTRRAGEGASLTHAGRQGNGQNAEHRAGGTTADPARSVGKNT
jgi:hypothetical protein